MVRRLPAKSIVIAPSHVHIQMDSFVSAGSPPTSTFGAPGTHGATVAGTQGAGVGVPSAAAVAAMTSGFVGALHMPNVGMLTMGFESMIDAAGRPSTMTRASGSTLSTEGARPNEHFIIAPATTCCDMKILLCQPLAAATRSEKHALDRIGRDAYLHTLDTCP